MIVFNPTAQAVFNHKHQTDDRRAFMRGRTRLCWSCQKESVPAEGTIKHVGCKGSSVVKYVCVSCKPVKL
jgi:hypothetical protein